MYRSECGFGFYMQAVNTYTTVYGDPVCAHGFSSYREKKKGSDVLKADLVGCEFEVQIVRRS